MTKKICLVGGEDVHKRINLSKYLIEAGYNVTIIGTSTVSFPENINYITYKLNRRFSPISDYETVKWYKKFFKENTFDIIHTFDTKPAFLVPFALLKTKTPITRTVTGLGTIFMSTRLSYILLRKIYMIMHTIVRKRVFKTIFQNTDDRNLYMDSKLINENNSEIILSSGIELKTINQIALRNNKSFTFIFVARLVYEKGIINLLEAAKICYDKGHDFKYLIVGPLEENSKRLNKSILNSYKNIVSFLDQRKDVMDLLLKSDAFVLPTFREGFPRVLLEAAAVGLPIISTNAPGVRQYAKHNVEALLVEVNNSKELSDSMIQLAENKVLAEKLAKNGLKHVKQFSLQKVSNQYITIFDAAIN